MNRPIRRGLVAAAVIASAAAGAPVTGLGAPALPLLIDQVNMIATPTGMRPVVRDVLVRFDAGTAVRAQLDTRSRVFGAAGAQPEGARRVEGLPGAWRVPVDKGASPAAVARRLDARADVTWAVPAVPASTQAMPNDPLFPNLWGLSNTGQQVQAPTPFTGLAGVDVGAMGAWATTRGSADVPVAVVDYGTVLDHPDLAANLRSANDRNFVPDADGDVDPRAVEDDQGHGTHVAGTIGAVGNNGLGVVGVNWTAGMTTVRACGNLGGGCPYYLEGMAYAGPRARVVNVSIVGPGDLQPDTDVIGANPNTLFVVAAGNNHSDNDAHPVGPCNVPLPNVLCVANLGPSGVLASDSNYGATSVDIAAPGVEIQSPMPNFTTVFAPAITSDGESPPRPDGWTQTPEETWTWGETGNGWGFVDLNLTPGPGSDVEGWVIEAPGNFTAAGQACQLDAWVRTDLDWDENQALGLAYRTGEGSWLSVPGSGVTGSNPGVFSPWKVDLSLIDGQAGVELAFVVVSAQGAGSLRLVVTSPVVKCIVPQPAGGSYGFKSGTSMAAPQVAGAAALLLAKNPSLTAVQVKHALMSTAVPMASLAGKVVTGGRVDVNAALASVPAPASATPAAPAAPAAPIARALTLRVGARIAIRPGGTRAPVPVTCDQPSTTTCPVTVALRMRVSARDGTRARWIALGTRSVTLPGTWRGRVSVPLTREARNLLARHARVRATVIAASKGDQPSRAPVRQASTLVRR